MSSNPILTRTDTFNGRGGFQQPARQPYPQDPYGYGQPGTPQAPVAGRMTVEDVLTKTVISLAVVFAAALVTFQFLPWTLLQPVWIGAGLATFVVALVVGRMRTVSATGVMVFAVIEGVFVGGITKLFDYLYPGVATQAVLATFVAAGVVLFTYKYLNVRLSQRFMRTVAMVTMAYAGVLLLNFVLSIAGVQLGFTPAGFTWLGMITALIGATLAVLSLMSDIQQIDGAIRVGAPESESWRGAFALTVTMVWLYTELLRILSYLRGN